MGNVTRVAGLIACITGMLVSNSANATTTGCVVGVSPGNELNLRAGPGKRFQIIGGIDADSCDVFIDSQCIDGFCRVTKIDHLQRAEDESGWASEGFLRRGANPGKVPELKWVSLGNRVVNFSTDRDVIQLSRSDGRFRAIQLVVSDNDVFMEEVRVIYGNGQSESIPVREEIKSGRRSRVMDLAGRARFMKRVEFLYKSDRSGNRKAKVELFGIKYDPKSTPQRRKYRPRQVSISTPATLQWQLLGTKSIQGKLDRDRVKVGRSAGQYRAIQLVVKKSDIEFVDVQVHFGNGQVQDVPIRSLIRAGSSSRVIDLRGENRAITAVDLVYKRRKDRAQKYARAVVDVYGLHVGAEFAGRTMVAPAASTGTTKTHTEIGILNCEVSGGLGFIIGSSKELSCRFNRPGRDENYFGSINKFGLDIGATTKGVMSWAVLARTTDIPPGALTGQFVGVSGEVTLGAGIGANALIGGSKRSVVLQPLSVQAQLGLNLALGVSELNLRR